LCYSHDHPDPIALVLVGVQNHSVPVFNADALEIVPDDDHVHLVRLLKGDLEDEWAVGRPLTGELSGQSLPQ
jgi:hypothetical protein